MKPSFDHEKLRVYQKAIVFVCWTNAILEKCPKGFSVHNQLERASTSIPLNIAEGNGKYQHADRCKFLDIARGSALECAACLDVLVARTLLNESDILEGKQELTGIVSMLVGLIKSLSEDRVCEEPASYSICVQSEYE